MKLITLFRARLTRYVRFIPTKFKSNRKIVFGVLTFLTLIFYHKWINWYRSTGITRNVWGRNIDTIYQARDRALIPVSPSLSRRGGSKSVLMITTDESYSSTVKDSFTLARIDVTFKLFNQIIYEIDNELCDKNYILLVIPDLGDLMSESREKLDKIVNFCKENGINMLVFAQYSQSFDSDTNGGVFGLSTYNLKGIHSFEMEARSPMWHLTKPGKISNISMELDWTSFRPSEEILDNYRPILYSCEIKTSTNHVVAVEDLGKMDGVRKIIIGKNLPPDVWFLHLLFVDSLKYLTGGLIKSPLERYILFDIDDVFFKRNGPLYMEENDVDYLVHVQNDMREYINGFKFNLGFFGSYFARGSESSVQTDKAFLAQKNNFWWYPRFWSSIQPHVSLDVDNITKEVQLNLDFAKEHGLPLTMNYTVPPLESGVFPVVKELYSAWKKSKLTPITSTTLYNTRTSIIPFHRGFQYLGATVLPRFYVSYDDQVDGGGDENRRMKSAYEKIYNGSLLLQTLYNTVLIFRTQCQDYTGRRPAVHALHNLMAFLRQFTNLNFKTEQPHELASRYFDLYPAERNTPFWQNPCYRKSLLAKWPIEYAKQCSIHSFPDVIIAGPQKTGTTALLTFLKLHPAVKVNLFHPVTHEETQFYSNDQVYENGTEWYVSRFPMREQANDVIIEKSATYFIDLEATPRMNALLPDAKIIIILLEPTRRAQSHYYHFLHHDVPPTSQYSIQEFFTQNKSVPEDLEAVRGRVLRDSVYVTHIERWLSWFPSNQLLFVDGSDLVEDPVTVMNDMQTQLNLNPKLNFSDLIRYDEEKGFYCIITHHQKNDCLGDSKGREYPELDSDTFEYLQNFFKPFNEKLAQLLKNLGRRLPRWLLSYAH